LYSKCAIVIASGIRRCTGRNTARDAIGLVVSLALHLLLSPAAAARRSPRIDWGHRAGARRLPGPGEALAGASTWSATSMRLATCVRFAASLRLAA
jgi:hypothetical protein